MAMVWNWPNSSKLFVNCAASLPVLVFGLSAQGINCESLIGTFVQVMSVIIPSTPSTNLTGGNVQADLDIINTFISTPIDADSTGADLYLFNNY